MIHFKFFKEITHDKTKYHKNSFNDQINNFIQKHNITKIIDLKSSQKVIKNDNEFTSKTKALLIYKK